MTDEEALERVEEGNIGEGSIVVLGRPDENRFAEWMISQERIPCESTAWRRFTGLKATAVVFPANGGIGIAERLVLEDGAGQGDAYHFHC